MKNTFLLLLSSMMSAATQAQVPVNRTMAMVEKATASWCAPCGTYGWTLQEELISDNMAGSNPNAMVMETHGTFSVFRTNTADSMIQGWAGSSIPAWAVNNVAHVGDRYAIKKTVDAFVASSPTASTGFYYILNGNTIKFYTSTKFWKAASGTYAMGAYIVEDSAYGEQQGLPGAVGYHRYVLRDHISKGVFGDTLASGSIAANQSYSKSYTYTITRTDWVKSHLKFLTVVWKRTGSAWNSWEVVSVNSLKSMSTGVGNEAAAVDQLIVYPNPATNLVHISGALNVAADAHMVIMNAIGQTVSEKTVPSQGGQLAEDIDVSGFPNGVYMLLIRSEGAQTAQRLVVAR